MELLGFNQLDVESATKDRDSTSPEVDARPTVFDVDDTPALGSLEANELGLA